MEMQRNKNDQNKSKKEKEKNVGELYYLIFTFIIKLL